MRRPKPYCNKTTSTNWHNQEEELLLMLYPTSLVRLQFYIHLQTEQQELIFYLFIFLEETKCYTSWEKSYNDSNKANLT